MEWISVKDRLPSSEGYYLVLDYKHIEKLMFREGFFWTTSCYDYDHTNEDQKSMYVTHWMPLPQPPKEMNEKTDKHCGNCICECTCRVFDIDHNDECPSHK